MTSGEHEDDLTLSAYEAHSDQYAERTTLERAPLVDELLRVTPPGASVLELGSGPGRDAAAMEDAGLVVHRTDGAASFVNGLRENGHSARVLNFYADDFGGPYDAIYAHAVLLHATRDRLPSVLRVALRSVRAGGILAASFKMGEGDAWSDQKLDTPRHFTYWQQIDLREVVTRAGWEPVTVAETVATASPERWITVIARRAER